MAEKTYLLSDGSEEIVPSEHEQAFLDELKENNLTATLQVPELGNQIDSAQSANVESDSSTETDQSQINQQQNTESTLVDTSSESEESVDKKNYSYIAKQTNVEANTNQEVEELLTNNENYNQTSTVVEETEQQDPFEELAFNKFAVNLVGDGTGKQVGIDERAAAKIMNQSFESIRVNMAGGGIGNNAIRVTMPDGLNMDGEIGSIYIDLNTKGEEYEESIRRLKWVWDRNKELKEGDEQSQRGFIIGDIFGRRRDIEVGGLSMPHPILIAGELVKKQYEDTYSDDDLDGINLLIKDAGYELKSNLTGTGYTLTKSGQEIAKGGASEIQNYMFNNVSDEDIRIFAESSINATIDLNNEKLERRKEKHGTDENGNIDYSNISTEGIIDQIFESGTPTSFLIEGLKKELSTIEPDDLYTFDPQLEYDEYQSEAISKDVDFIIKYLTTPSLEDGTLEEYQLTTTGPKEYYSPLATSTREVDGWQRIKYENLRKLIDDGLIKDPATIRVLNKLLNDKLGWSNENVLEQKKIQANKWDNDLTEDLYSKNPNYIKISFALDQQLKKTKEVDANGDPLYTTLPLWKEQINIKNETLITEFTKLQDTQKLQIGDLRERMAEFGIGFEIRGTDPNSFYAILNTDNFIIKDKYDILAKELKSEKYIKDGQDVIATLEQEIVSANTALEDIQSQINTINQRYENGEYKTEGEIEEIQKQVNDLTLLYETIENDITPTYENYKSLINDKNLLIKEYNKSKDEKSEEIKKAFQEEINKILKNNKDLFTQYSDGVLELEEEMDKYETELGELNANKESISKEMDTMTLIRKDLEGSFENMFWSVGSVFGNQYSMDKLTALEEGAVGLKTMLDWETAIEFNSKGEFAGRTMGQQFAPVAMAVGGSLLGIPSIAIAGLYSIQEFGGTKARLWNDVDKGKEADRLLIELEENKHLLSTEEYASAKSRLEGIKQLGDLDALTINLACTAAGAGEFLFTRYFGTIPNASKAISQLFGKFGPSVGSLITRSNMMAALQGVGSFGRSVASEATEELGIYFSNVFSQGLILGRDMKWDGWDDVLVSTILTVGPMNGPTQVYSTITQQFATKDIRSDIKKVTNDTKLIFDKLSTLKPGKKDDLYRSQLKQELHNNLKKLRITQAGLEVDALLAGGAGTKKMIQAAYDLAKLHAEAKVDPNDSETTINKKIKDHLSKLSENEKSDFRSRLKAVEDIRNSVFEQTNQKLSENIMEEGGVVEKLFGNKGKEIHDMLLEKSPAFKEMSSREKLIAINLNMQKNRVNSQVREVKNNPLFKQHVENILYNGKFEDSGRKNRKKKEERKMYENLANRFNTRKVQATSIYRGQKQAVQQILDSNPDIKELSDLNVESELTIDDLKNRLNEFNLSKKEKNDILKGLDDGSIKGIILGGNYMTTATKDAVNKELQAGNVLQGTVFSHEFGHALDNLTMKEGELETYAENLYSHMIDNKALKTINDLVVDQLSNLTGPDGKILFDKDKGFADQSTVGKDEYIKRVQDILQDPAFESELKEARKSAGKSIYNIIKGTKVGAKFLGGDFTLDTGKDAMNYLVSYIDSFKEGKLSELVKRKYKAKKDVGDTTVQQGARASADASVVNRMGDFYKDDNKLWKEEGHQAVMNILQDKKLLDGLILDAQAKANPFVQIKNQSQEIKNNFIQDVYTEINNHVRNFNPEINNDLFAWINSQLGNKALNVQKRPEYSGDKLTRAKDLEARTEEGALIYQPASTDLSPEEIMIAKEDAQRSQIKQEILSERFGLDEGAEARFEEALIKAFGTKLPEVTDKKMRTELRKIVSDEVRPIVQGIMGTEQDFNAFIQNDLGPLLDFIKVDDLIQMERKVGGKTFPGGRKIFAERKRITKVKEVIKLQDAGKIDPRIKPETGPSLKTRLKPTPQELMAYFRGFYIDNNGERQPAEKLLGYQPSGSMDTGILGTRKDRIAELLVGEIAMDNAIKIARKVLPKILQIEGLQGREVRDNYIAEFGLTIDRDPTIVDKESSYRLSAEGVDAGTPSGAEFIIEADFLANEVEQNGYESVFDENGNLIEGYPTSPFTATFVKSLYDHGAIEEDAAIRFKQGIFKSKLIDQETKDEYKKVGNLRYNIPELKKLNKDANTIASALGKDVMNALPNEVLYELLGYKNRVMDPAAKKKDGSIGDFYESLQKIKTKVNKGKSKLVSGVILEDVNIMNIGATGSVFKDIAKILNKDITASEKKKQLAKLQPRIDAANMANIGLAKHIAKTIIDLAKKGKISKISALNILQSQTGIVNGFRGLSRLDLIQVLDGSQKVGENHPLFKDAVKYYKKKGFKNPKEKALQRLGYKGEHLAPNSNTMLKIAELIFNPSANIDYELDQALQGHSQMLSSKYATDVIDDKGGKNNTTNYHRVKFLDQKDISNIVSIEGRSYTEVLADREIDSVKSKLLKQSNYRSKKINNTIDAFNKQAELIRKQNKAIQADLEKRGYTFVESKKPKKGQTPAEMIEILEKDLKKRGYRFSKDDLTKKISASEVIKILEEDLKKKGYTFVDKPRFSKAKSAADVIEILKKDLEERGYTFVDMDNKGMSAFDFDETLIIDGKNFVIAIHPKTGKEIKINSAKWPIEGPKLAAKGYNFNFDDFVKVRGGVEGPLFQKLKNRIEKFGPENNFVLTARPQEAAVAIHGWLKSKDVNIPIENITGLGNSTGEAKAQWMIDKFAEGYNDMYFVDDALPNVEAVKDVIDQLDIKGSSVQAKIRFSKDADSTFNEMLERATGIGKEKQFSAAESRLRGKSKGKFDFFVPPSAEDFKGLLYRFLGKGKQGEADLDFFKENLLNPYAKGYRDWNAYKQNMADDYASLKKKNKKIIKDFNKLVPGTNFTTENAIRVYLWDSNGIEIPGLSQVAKRKLVNHIKGNADLTAFANTLGNITKTKEGYTTPNDYWVVENIAGDLSSVVNKVGRNQFLKPWIENIDIIFSEKNLNKIEAAYGVNYREALENILYRMKTGNNRLTGKDGPVNRMLDWVNGSVGAIMFWNIRSAALQTISTVNYLNFADNNMFAASKAFANQPQFWKDFSFIFNSDMLRQRRSGLQIDVNASELTRAFANGRGKPQAMIAYLLEKGFTPTRIADSFAIASGGASFYRNRINKYIKEGMTKVEAEKQAWLDFQEITEETQQSSRPDLISQQQAGPLGRLILAFQNTPMQMTRLTKKALSDIVNKRGDMRSNIGKVMYYGLVQNIIFGALQSGLMFSLFGSNEEEEEKENQKKKSQRVLNGALDTLLRGTGIYGAAVSTLKNVILKWQEEREKPLWKRDDSNIILEALNFSPPIGSKLRKINSAVKTERFNKGVSEQLGLRVENPNLNIGANVIEGLTNLPLARALNKVNNIEEAITGNHEIWQRVALLSGWDKWSIGIKDEELEEAKIRAKQQRVEEKKKIKEQKKLEEQKAEEERKKKEGIKTVQCSGTRSNGKRCSLTTETKADSWLCQYHKSYKPNEKTDMDGDGIEETQCSAIKSNGKRCKNRTENKNGKCYAHQ